MLAYSLHTLLDHHDNIVSEFVSGMAQLIDAYIRYQPKPTLVQIMACFLFGTKPLSEPMLYWDP